MQAKNLGFLGAGNMATSLLGGLISDGYDAGRLWVSDVDAAKTQAMRDRWGLHVAEANLALAEAVDVLVLAVKPQMLQAVAREIAPALRDRDVLVISIAAGVTERSIESWLGAGVAVVRCMPNTPALVRAGATALHANAAVSDQQKSAAETILRSVGLTAWVESEALLDAVTALSGSGPAYFFLLMEAMEEAAVAMGLERGVARLLTSQTALGAGRIAIESDVSPAALRGRVTSPGGTTERAIQSFESAGFSRIVEDALRAAASRAVELSEQLGA